MKPRTRTPLNQPTLSSSIVTVPFTAPETAAMMVPRNNPQLTSVGAEASNAMTTTTTPAAAISMVRFMLDFGAGAGLTEEFACSFTPSVYEGSRPIGARRYRPGLSRTRMPQHPLQRHTGQRARLRMHPNHIRRTPLSNAIKHPE